jgi:hypothetical protein
MSFQERPGGLDGRPEDGMAKPCQPRRQRYTAPRLELLGDIRDLTLGGSPGQTDSSAPYLQGTPRG